MIEDYYRMAPAIVSAIERHADRKAILHDLYLDLVVESIFLIRAGRHEEAVGHYRSRVLSLRDRFLGP
jgi:hypothetical protein